jgi:flagellar biosynthetic protein FliR
MLELLPEHPEMMLLMFIRISAIMFLLPMIGDQGLPAMVKVGISLGVTLLLYPVVPLQPVAMSESLWGFFQVAMLEVMVGVAMGFATQLIFYGIQMSGQVIGIQMGFGIVNVLDPMTNLQVSIVSRVQYLFGFYLFLIIGGHHYFLLAVGESFRLVPIGSFSFTGGLMEQFVSMTGKVFSLAIRLGAPAMVALIMTDVALGFIARVAPQMNVFLVGFPLKIATGLIMLSLSLPMFATIFPGVLDDFVRGVIRCLALMRGIGGP